MTSAFERLRLYVLLELLRPWPLPRVIRFLNVLGQAKFTLDRAWRKRLTDFLRVYAPNTSEADLVHLARHQCVNFELRRYLNYLLLLHDARNFPAIIERRGWERIGSALQQNRGVILLSTHVGMPRLLRWLLRTTDYPVLYLLRIGFPTPADQSPRARFQRWHYKRYRLDDDPMAGNEELSVLYMKKAYDHLRKNGVVNIAGDGRSGHRQYMTTIGDRQQNVGLGSIELGLIARAPILPCFTSFTLDGRFCLEIQEPLAVPPVSDRNRQVRTMADEFAARIDAHIRQHPSSVAMRYLVDPE